MHEKLFLHEEQLLKQRLNLGGRAAASAASTLTSLHETADESESLKNENV